MFLDELDYQKKTRSKHVSWPLKLKLLLLKELLVHESEKSEY